MSEREREREREREPQGETERECRDVPVECPASTLMILMNAHAERERERDAHTHAHARTWISPTTLSPLFSSSKMTFRAMSRYLYTQQMYVHQPYTTHTHTHTHNDIYNIHSMYTRMHMPCTHACIAYAYTSACIIMYIYIKYHACMYANRTEAQTASQKTKSSSYMNRNHSCMYTNNTSTHVYKHSCMHTKIHARIQT